MRSELILRILLILIVILLIVVLFVLVVLVVLLILIVLLIVVLHFKLRFFVIGRCMTARTKHNCFDRSKSARLIQSLTTHYVPKRAFYTTFTPTYISF